MSVIVTARSAVISDDGLHRYALERTIVPYEPSAVAENRLMLVLGVNPSKADAQVDDPTVRRVYGFAASLGYARIAMANKFAYRATDVKELQALPLDKAVGPECDAHLERLMLAADVVVAAWGPLAKLKGAQRQRWKDVVRIADRTGRALMCWGTAQDGHPRHPLYLPGDAPLAPWSVPWFPNRRP